MYCTGSKVFTKVSSVDATDIRFDELDQEEALEESKVFAEADPDFPVGEPGCVASERETSLEDLMKMRNSGKRWKFERGIWRSRSNLPRL